MTTRIRHGVSCPHCQTRYLIGFSPYENGSYLVSTTEGSFEEYILYCSCREFPVPSRWMGDEIRTCEVSNPAYHRGYGSAEEVVFADGCVETIQLSARTISKPCPRKREEVLNKSQKIGGFLTQLNPRD